MILTDKALKDFYSKIYYTEDTNQVDETEEELIQEESKIWFNYQDERFQNALIIEFFDSVGIYIFIECGTYVREPYFKYRIVTDHDQEVSFKYNSRQEATEQAIQKANEIYNKNK